MKNMFLDKMKIGLEYMNEGIKVVKNEVLHQASKKVSWLDSPYASKNEIKTPLEKNIQFTNIVTNSEKTMFDDGRMKNETK